MSRIRIVCLVLTLHSFVAQQLSAQAGLGVFIVQGDNARNLIQQIPPEPLVVRVEEDRRPAAGATVTFTAPTVGASGQFANGSNSISVITERDGLAIAEGFHPNAFIGSYRIEVRATLQGQATVANIRQVNVEPNMRPRKLLTILAIAGAAVGAVLIARSGHDNGSTTTPTTRAVGAPRP